MPKALVHRDPPRQLLEMLPLEIEFIGEPDVHAGVIRPDVGARATVGIHHGRAAPNEPVGHLTHSLISGMNRTN